MKELRLCGLAPLGVGSSHATTNKGGGATRPLAHIFALETDNIENRLISAMRGFMFFVANVGPPQSKRSSKFETPIYLSLLRERKSQRFIVAVKICRQNSVGAVAETQNLHGLLATRTLPT